MGFGDIHVPRLSGPTVRTPLKWPQALAVRLPQVRRDGLVKDKVGSWASVEATRGGYGLGP